MSKQVSDIITGVSQSAGVVLDKAAIVEALLGQFDALGYHLPGALTQADFEGLNAELRVEDFIPAMMVLRRLMEKFDEPMTNPDGTPIQETDGTPTTPRKVLYRVKRGRPNLGF